MLTRTTMLSLADKKVELHYFYLTLAKARKRWGRSMFGFEAKNEYNILFDKIICVKGKKND